MSCSRGIELRATVAALSPVPDLALIEELLRGLSDTAQMRVMRRAIERTPKTEVIRLLVGLGVPLPREALWLAYADQLSEVRPSAAAYEKVRYLVGRGCQGIEGLRHAAAIQGHPDAIHSLILSKLSN